MHTTYVPNPQAPTSNRHPGTRMATRMARDRRATTIMVAAAMVAVSGMVVVTLLETHTPIVGPIVAPAAYGSVATPPASPASSVISRE